MPEGDLGRRRAALILASLPAAALAAACAEVPTLPDGPEDPLERHALLLEALDGAPLLAGNRVVLLDATAALVAMFRAIRAARDHVNLEFYILEDVRLPRSAAAAAAGRGGPTSLFALLAAKLRQGVAVTLIYDSIGSADTPSEALDTLRAAGARILAYNPANPVEARRGWRPNARDHRKILVVDGRLAVTGGVNLDRVYENACPEAGIAAVRDTETACWRDASVLLEGPAVAALQRLLLETWEAQGGGPLPPRNWFPPLPRRGDVRMRVLGSAPGERRPRFYVARMAAFEGARSRIWLCTGFFIPTRQERSALARAARRGVDVRLLLPGENGVAPAMDAQHAAYEDLLEAGVRIFEMRDAVLHAKLAAVDGVWSAVGSSNLDVRSVAWNNEVDLIMLGREMAAAIEATLQGGMAQAEPVDPERWRRRDLGERLRELAARLLSDHL